MGQISGDDAVVCDGICATWVHRRCAGLTYVNISKSTGPFFCPQCRLNKQELELSSLRDLVSSLSSKLEVVCSDLASVKSNVMSKALTYASIAKPGSQPDSLGTSSRIISSDTEGSRGQHVEKSSSDRRCNLVLFGLPESCKGTARHLRNRHDLEGAGGILSIIDPHVSVNAICDCFRLGKYEETQSRPAHSLSSLLDLVMLSQS